jgi:hypothetical protein
MSVVAVKSSLERFPPDLEDEIFSYLDEDSIKSMHQVSSTFYRRKVDILYPKELVVTLERCGKPLHRLPLLKYEIARRCLGNSFNSLSFDDVPDPMMRLPSDKKLFGVALRVHVKAVTFLEKDFLRIKEDFGNGFDWHFKDKVTQPLPLVYGLPSSQCALILYNHGTADWSRWYYRISKDDHYILDRWCARRAIVGEEHGLFYPSQTFSSEKAFYALLTSILKDEQPDFQLA